MARPSRIFTGFLKHGWMTCGAYARMSAVRHRSACLAYFERVVVGVAPSLAPSRGCDMAVGELGCCSGEVVPLLGRNGRLTCAYGCVLQVASSNFSPWNSEVSCLGIQSRNGSGCQASHPDVSHVASFPWVIA